VAWTFSLDAASSIPFVVALQCGWTTPRSSQCWVPEEVLDQPLLKENNCI